MSENEPLCACGHRSYNHGFRRNWCSRCDCECFQPPMDKHAAQATSAADDGGTGE